MRRTILKLAIVAVAAISLTACCEGDKPKFNAKEYAERRTEKLDEIVDLTDAQEKEVYAVYLAQGKEIQKSLKNLKKECPEGKKHACDKAKCDKPCDKAKCEKTACDKAKCEKTACDKAKCDKPACDKAKCEKPACDKAKCDKPACDKAKCEKPTCDKAKCDKTACDKAKCEKKAECPKKADHKRVECDGKKPMPRHAISPEMRKANIDRIRGILTDEQNAKFKAHLKARHQCAPEGKPCIPTPQPKAPATK